MEKSLKELLLKDLCARLPYGVKVQDTYYLSLKPITPWLVDMIKHEVRLYADEDWQSIENIKSYLRPISSMTKEECIELGNIASTLENVCEHIPNVPYYIEVSVSDQIDWLNAHHFDYRGLIEKGLALEAPEDMYK